MKEDWSGKAQGIDSIHHAAVAFDQRAMAALKTERAAIAREVNAHPATLGYMLGNELNQAYWNRSLSALWPAINEIAGEILRHDTNHVLTSALSDQQLVENAGLKADVIESLWKELERNRRIASGGAVFEWTDEWWGIHRLKPGSPDLLEPRAAVARLRKLWPKP